MPKKRAARLAASELLRNDGDTTTSRTCASSSNGNYDNITIMETSSAFGTSPASPTSTNNGAGGTGGYRKYVLFLISLGVILGLYNLYESAVGVTAVMDVNNNNHRVVGMMRSTTATTTLTATANHNDDVTSTTTASSITATTTTSTATDAADATTTTTHHDNDQYSRLLEQPASIQSLREQLQSKWISYAQTPPQQQRYFLEVYECTQRFQDSAMVHDGLNATSFVYRDGPVFGSGSRTLEAFLVGNSATELSQSYVQELVSKRNNMLFAGDAVIKQQFFYIVCAINPSVQQQDFTLYAETHAINTHFQYDYKHTNGVTIIRYEEVGYIWNKEMHELFFDAFPKAIETFGPNDVIVVDSSRQFDVKDIVEFERTLEFIKTKAAAATTKATIYYMEPTPQEYPTSNGYNIGMQCTWKCQCQMLTDLTLGGTAKPFDPAFAVATTTPGKEPTTGLDMTSPETISHRTSIEDLTTTLVEPFSKLYGNDRAATFTKGATEQDSSSCLPNCIPATWQVDLVRSILLNQEQGDTIPASNNNNNLQLVPTYWQMVGRSQHSSMVMRGDCTHRGPDAVVFMNEQLLRSIRDRDDDVIGGTSSSSANIVSTTPSSSVLDGTSTTTTTTTSDSQNAIIVNSAASQESKAVASTTELNHDDTHNIPPSSLDNPCGLLNQPSNNLETLRQQMKTKWISYQQTSRQQQDYFLQVYNCGLRFRYAYVNDGLNKISFLYRDSVVFGGLSRTLDAMVCDDTDGVTTTQTKLQQLVSQRNNMLFAGDSVLKQQYFIFICMLEPNAEIEHFTEYTDTGGMGSRFQYNYNHTQRTMDPSTGAAETTTTTTSIRYESIGKVWNKEMHQLWYEAFPKAVESFSKQDVIVMDSSRHFNTADIEEFERVLEFIRTKAMEAKASIYYMEPTPQEWPTSNGFHIQTCSWVCQCHPLSDLSIQGTAKPYDSAQIEEVDVMVSNKTLFSRTSIANLTTNLVEPFSKLYGNDRAATFTKQATEQDMSCLPDCVPATWRVDLVRSVILQQQQQQQEHQQGTSQSVNVNNLHLVPVYWQLVGRSQHSSILMKGDCTHRGIDAVAFMNEQLIRSISEHEKKMQVK